MVNYMLYPSLVYSFVHYSVVLHGRELLTYDVSGTNLTVLFEANEIDYTKKFLNWTLPEDHGRRINPPHFIVIIILFVYVWAVTISCLHSGTHHTKVKSRQSEQFTKKNSD